MLSRLRDPRKRWGRRHALVGVVAVGIAAAVAGARSFAAVAEWVADQDASGLNALGIRPGRVPTESTIRRLFTRLDPNRLDAAIEAWFWTTTSDIAGRRVIAIDGKTVRGARAADHTAPHLVAAFDHAASVVLGQLAVAAKTTEIPTVRDLLHLTQAVITLDALHTQKDTAAQITGAGGDYVLTIKDNTPSLRAACKRLPWRDVPAHSGVQSDRGRRTRRTIKVTTAPAWVDFPRAAQIAQIRRTRTVKGKTTVEVVYVLTRADHHGAPPPVLATWVQGHWAVENNLHYVRDVTYAPHIERHPAGHDRLRHDPQVIALRRGPGRCQVDLHGEVGRIAATHDVLSQIPHLDHPWRLAVQLVD